MEVVLDLWAWGNLLGLIWVAYHNRHGIAYNQIPTSAPYIPGVVLGVVQTLSVTVPDGASPGQLLQVNLPGGGNFQTQVPVGAMPGQQFLVALPAASTE